MKVASRLLRVIGRCGDGFYLSNFFDRLRTGVTMKRNLRSLKEYHLGAKRDFSHIKEQYLARTVRYACARSPYYHEVFQRSGVGADNLLDRWNQVPLLDKKEIQCNLNRILCVEPAKNYVGYQTTGGSTGEPFAFHTLGGVDAEHQAFLFDWMGWKPGDRILAFDGTTVPELERAKGIFWAVKSKCELPYGSVAMSSHYLTPSTIDHYLRGLVTIRPAIIRGYPSFLEAIARLILERGYRFNFKIKGVQLTSESFYENQVSVIQSAFCAPVYSQYGHAEASVFGYTINDTLLTYCSPFYGFTEVVDEHGCHVSEGEVGEIVVTGFHNYAMPFIRYRTGDLGEYAGTEDGLVKIRKVHGRTQDIVYTRDLRAIRLTALVFGQHYKAFKNITKWQLFQDQAGVVRVRIIPGQDYSQADEAELAEGFSSIAGIDTVFEYVDTLPLTKRGKSKFLVQMLVV